MILLTEEKDEKVLARARELILASRDEKWRANALSTAITVARRYFPKEFLLKLFREELRMLQEADIVQDWINQGIEKGLVKGQIKTLQEAIMDILEDRFGLLKKGIGKKLATVDDPAVLRFLFRKSIKVESLEEFARLLEEV